MDENTKDKDIKFKRKVTSQLPKVESLLKDLLAETQTEAEIEKEKIESTLKQREEEDKKKKKRTDEILLEDFKRKIEEERKKREEQILQAEERKKQKELEEKQAMEKSDLIVLKEVAESKKKPTKNLIIAGAGGFAGILIAVVLVLVFTKQEKGNDFIVPLNSDFAKASSDKNEIVQKQSIYSSKPVLIASKEKDTTKTPEPVEIISQYPPKALPKQVTQKGKTGGGGKKGAVEKKQKTGTKLIKTNIFGDKIIK